MTSARAAKKELILSKAFELFCEKGYLDTKIIEIAEAAGIGKGTVYEYFGSKEDLFFELFDRYVIRHYHSLPALLQEVDSTREKLRLYIRFEMEFMSAVGNGKNHMGRFMSDPNLFQDPRLCEAIGNFMKFRSQALYDIVAEGIAAGQLIQQDPELVTVAVSGAVNSFLTRNYNLIGMDENAAERKLWSEENLLPILMNGLLVKKEEA